MKKILLHLTILLCMVGSNAQSTSRICLTNDFATHKSAKKKKDDSGYRTTQQELVSDRTWPVGSEITVSFIDRPTPKVFSKIKQYAQEWEKYANIDFVFLKYGQIGQVRIGLESGVGHWSYIGTDALKVNGFVKTMNFDGFNNATKEGTFSRKVLHEFGHALGLKHEHQSPAAGICWIGQLARLT